MQSSAASLDTFPPEHDIEWWGHKEHWHVSGQLLYAATGACTLSIEGTVQRVDERTAVWLAPGVVHACRFDDDFSPVSLFASGAPGLPDIAAFRVDERLRSRLLRGGRESDPLRAEILANAILQTLHGAGTIAVAHAQGPLTGPIVRAFEQNPANDETLEVWAARLHCGVASIRRAFVAETGSSFTDWRTRFRLVVSLDRLSAGVPVAVVASEVGMTHSGYAAAFRRIFGRSPRGPQREVA